MSDRDPRFVTNFWQALRQNCGTELAMSTAYHPQTDGQTERMNWTLEEVLRSYVQPHQRDWSKHLIAIEVAYNDSRQESTQVTPFYLQHGFHPKMLSDIGVMDDTTPAARDFLAKIKPVLDKAV